LTEIGVGKDEGKKTQANEQIEKFEILHHGFPEWVPDTFPKTRLGLSL
jgi:hypothetical protein